MFLKRERERERERDVLNSFRSLSSLRPLRSSFRETGSTNKRRVMECAFWVPEKANNRSEFGEFNPDELLKELEAP